MGIKSNQTVTMRIFSLALFAAVATAKVPCTSTVKSLPNGGFCKTITQITDKIERKCKINYYADGAKDWDFKVKLLQKKEEKKPEDKPKDKPKDKPEDKPKDKPEDKPKEKPKDKPEEELLVYV